MKDSVFSSKIVEWYARHHRQLPWRKTRDPYKIWLSEIILQQTRVLQGLPYYLKFIQRYPTISALAAAPERDILRLWQGLGYYSRARNLRKCAKAVVDDHSAKFPGTFIQLKTLAGIGDYTAAAIASFAFDERVAVVDGNVFRVLARVFGVHEGISSAQGKRRFSELANRLIPAVDPGTHNQAIMEFGATHCLPRNPKCETCPFKRVCFASQQNLQQFFPVKVRAKKPRPRYFYYLVACHGDKILLKERGQGDIWTGLYDFPLLETTSRVPASQIRTLLVEHKGIQNRSIEELKISAPHKHVLSHQIIHARFVALSLKKESPLPASKLFVGSAFYTARQIARLPKPILISRYLDKRLFR